MRAPGPQRLPGDAGRAARDRTALRWRRWWRSAHEVEPAELLGHADGWVAVVKVIHTAAWFSIESCVAYLLYAGLSGRTDRRAAIAAGVVFGESALFAANRFRCPLTELAQSLGAESGSVTELYLPKWFAHNLPAIHVPLLVLVVFLHGRTVFRHRAH
jgi:hypothetical protein